MFAYCGNNPVSRKDMAGGFFCTAIGAIVGAAFGALEAVIDGKSGNEFKASVLSGATSGAISGAAADVLMLTGGSAGLVVGVMAAAGAVGAVAGNVVEAEITDRPVDWEQTVEDAVWDASLGALFAYMNGPIKSGLKNISKIGLVKSLVRFVRDEAKEIVPTIIEEILGNTISSLARFTSDVFKQNVQNLLN